MAETIWVTPKVRRLLKLGRFMYDKILKSGGRLALFKGDDPNKRSLAILVPVAVGLSGRPTGRAELNREEVKELIEALQSYLEEDEDDSVAIQVLEKLNRTEAEDLKLNLEEEGLMEERMGECWRDEFN